MLSIITAPQPVLRQIAKPVQKIDKKLLDLIADMTSALLAAKDPQGVGLAAPQVGEPLQLFLIRPDTKHPPQLLINPEILHYSQRLQSPHGKNGVYEGCLSLPQYYAPLRRSLSVTVRYDQLPTPLPEDLSTARLQSVTANFTGFPAHVVQHETDHLKGILFVDRVLEQQAKLYHIQGKTWTEVEI